MSDDTTSTEAAPPGEPAGSGFQSIEDELAGVPNRVLEEQTPAGDGSALTSIRARREKARAALEFDLWVPRYDPPLFVRFKPVRQTRIEEVNKEMTRRGVKNRTVMVNATILAEHCLGVGEVVDGEKVSLDPDDRHGEWPKFDQRLAEIIGEPMAKKSTDVVRALYLTEGDLISACETLGLRSGYAQESADVESAGN